MIPFWSVDLQRTLHYIVNVICFDSAIMCQLYTPLKFYMMVEIIYLQTCLLCYLHYFIQYEFVAITLACFYFCGLTSIYSFP
jgi:hypothetical protein